MTPKPAACVFCGRKPRSAKASSGCPECCVALRHTGLFKPDIKPTPLVQEALDRARPGAKRLALAAKAKTNREGGISMPASIALLEVLLAMNEATNPWDILELPEVTSRLRTAWGLAYLVPGLSLSDDYTPIFQVLARRMAEPKENRIGRPRKSDALQDVLSKNLDDGVKGLAAAIHEASPEKAMYYTSLRAQLIEPNPVLQGLGVPPRPEAASLIPAAADIVAGARNELDAHQSSLPLGSRLSVAAKGFSRLLGEVSRAEFPLRFQLPRDWAEILATYDAPLVRGPTARRKSAVLRQSRSRRTRQRTDI